MNICKNCLKETNNPSFCSRSCNATYNNKVIIKRKWHCKSCHKEKPRPSKHARLCADCNEKSLPKHLTLKSLRDFYRHKDNKHRQNEYVYVREQSRRIALANGMNKCEVCGYDKFVEIAHKRAVASYPDEALISEINDISNLMALCPNHHWEYDHP